jgi:hypothetical protein
MNKIKMHCRAKRALRFAHRLNPLGASLQADAKQIILSKCIESSEDEPLHWPNIVNLNNAAKSSFDSANNSWYTFLLAKTINERNKSIAARGK